MGSPVPVQPSYREIVVQAPPEPLAAPPGTPGTVPLQPGTFTPEIPAIPAQPAVPGHYTAPLPELPRQAAVSSRPAGSDPGTLANEIGVTLQAQQAFEQAVTALTMIASEVFASQQMLTTNAMVTTAGQVFGSVVVRWAEDFEDLRSTLNWMAQQLGDTALQLQRGNQQSAEMAAALPQFGQDGFAVFPLLPSHVIKAGDVTG